MKLIMQLCQSLCDAQYHSS